MYLFYGLAIAFPILAISNSFANYIFYLLFCWFKLLPTVLLILTIQLFILEHFSESSFSSQHSYCTLTENASDLFLPVFWINKKYSLVFKHNDFFFSDLIFRYHMCFSGFTWYFYIQNRFTRLFQVEPTSDSKIRDLGTLFVLWKQPDSYVTCTNNILVLETDSKTIHLTFLFKLYRNETELEGNLFSCSITGFASASESQRLHSCKYVLCSFAQVR